MKSSVSVIIPFFSGVPWLIEAVESVINQSFKAEEIIVVNDGSIENIENFLTLFRDRIIYVYKTNGGPASARNAGIEKSTCDYYAFLDSDDIWNHDKLEIQISLMKEQNAVWSHTSYETFVKEKTGVKILKTVQTGCFSGMIYPKMLMSNTLATPSIVIRGDLFRNCKEFRFNDNVRHGEDQILWTKIALEHPILAIDKVLVSVRVRGSNAALQTRVQLESRAVIWSMIQKDKEKFRFRQIPFLAKLAFSISDFGAHMLFMIKKNIRNPKILEWISRLLYVIPWITFKISSKICKMKMKKSKIHGQ